MFIQFIMFDGTDIIDWQQSHSRNASFGPSLFQETDFFALAEFEQVLVLEFS